MYSDANSLLLKFKRKKERWLIINYLILYNILCYTDHKFLLDAVQVWKYNKISNFEYLLVLNTASR